MPVAFPAGIVNHDSLAGAWSEGEDPALGQSYQNASRETFWYGSKVIAIRNFGPIEEGAPGIIIGMTEYPFLWWSRPMYLCMFAGNVKVGARPKEIDDFDHGWSVEMLENPDVMESIQLQNRPEKIDVQPASSWEASSITRDTAEQSTVRSRALDYIRKYWGTVKDLPRPVVSVIWVTVYRSLELGMKLEAEGGTMALLKNTLIGDRTLVLEVEHAIARLKFLHKMIPLRNEESQGAKLAIAHLTIDVLKWNIRDAGKMSGFRRTIARQFAKADQEYKNPVPPELIG